MLHAISEQALPYRGDLVNLKDLRYQLTSRLALLLIGASSLAMVAFLLQEPFPLVAFGLLAALFGLGWIIQAQVKVHPNLARHLLTWGLTASLVAAMGLFNDLWLPFLGLSLIFVGALLVSGGELATAGIIGLAATWLTYRQVHIYPLPELAASLALGMAATWSAVHIFDTALEWAWNMQRRADHLLETTRQHQAELSRIVKSLDLTNALLQRTQNELIVARRKADEARHLKEQFAANISHELRTPLNLILGFSEVMYLSPQVYGEMGWPPALRRDVYQIYRSSRHLMEMIDDILDLSRFEIAGFTLNKEPTSLGQLLQGAAEIAQDLFRGRPVNLEVDIAPDLPTLEIDRTRIRQVVLNMLNNAQRFTEAGAVRLEAKRTEREVVISINDTGPGIPADQLQKIFDEFYQVDRSLRRSHKGAGLGLAISKRFVEAHEGRIWAESQEGQGATFFFTLPIPGQSSPLAPSMMERPVEPAWSKPRSSILVIEPDPLVAAWIRRHIAEYDVIPVESADSLDDLIRLHHPRAVIHNVPPTQRSGHDDRTSTSLSLPVPVIECSLPSQAWVANELAVAACLTKPITSQGLLQEIEHLGDIHDILIVDDDKGFRQLVERILEACGEDFKVRHAYDGIEGLAAMHDRLPDLILLDLIMPGMDGFQMLEEMRREPGLADVPVVLLTATSLAEDTLAQRGSQVTVYRPDGLQPAEVLQCLRAVIETLKPRYDERSAPKEVLPER
jgi:signal transduction histidine kinase/CheY-like chemotaxis protein